jgi:hypothetical protein
MFDITESQRLKLKQIFISKKIIDLNLMEKHVKKFLSIALNGLLIIKKRKQIHIDI